MSISDKKKLDGIASGANNYTLPTASAGTLGGIKTGYSSADSTRWAVAVDIDGRAYVPINGLHHSSDGNVSNLIIGGSNTAIINARNIIFDTQEYGDYECYFPSKSGTFALTDDIPDVSSLCRFNFVNSISECATGRINFLLGCSENLIDLDSFDIYPNGTILLITTTDNTIPIKHQSGIWYSGGDKMNKNETHYTYKDRINLITINNRTVHHYEF